MRSAVRGSSCEDTQGSSTRIATYSGTNKACDLHERACRGLEAVQVTDVNSESHTILKAGALRLGNQPDIEESLANSAVGILKPIVGAPSLERMPVKPSRSGSSLPLDAAPA
jgi:hypothetical protein